MHCLNFRLLAILFLVSNSVCFADSPIIIKKYKRPSKALLNKKIIYMDMGEAPRSKQTSSKGIGNLAAPVQSKTSNSVHAIPQKTYNVNKISTRAFAVKKLTKKSPLASIASKGSGSENNSVGEYSDDDWGEYTQYREVELEESLGVSAKIRR